MGAGKPSPAFVNESNEESRKHEGEASFVLTPQHLREMPKVSGIALGYGCDLIIIAA